MPEPTVAVCIMSYNRPQEVREAVASGRAAGADEVVVLDSASDVPLGDLDEARVIRSEANLGCGGGRNRLAADTGTDVLLFLDDDAVLHRDAVERVRRAFAEDPGLGAVALRIVRPDGRLVAMEQPFRRGRRVPGTRTPCTYFIGAGFAVRRSAYAGVGGSDPRLFYGTDDVDLAFRLLHAGWRIAYEPEAVVEHRPSPRGRMASAEKTAHHLGNRIIVARTYLPAPVAAVHIAAWLALTGREALEARDLRTWLGGIGRGLRERVERRRLAPARLVEIHRLGGRVLY